ncbi:MAG TPA: FAD-linked oxidase C-terminal domain-containing protein [Verrucomicrobiae bacterium]|nr:FAD-linked oxidase C-terminal domain-containing protein [Verrucomicrobiae bacterium]
MNLSSALARLKKLLPAGELRLEESVRARFAGDKWFVSRVPDAVVLPRSARSVASLLAFAHQHRIPVTARGAGYGYVGSCVPNRGGIVLSLERMNRIKEIHETDFVAVVQPGVLTKTLQDAVEKRGLFYPPDPASRADCSLGGNIATNAGGPRCLKYGVTRDYVLGLEVALADGSLVRLGGRTHKNKTGFDLHRLFVGSEGLLGVITEATLKLIPLPRSRACLAVGFASTRAATGAIQQIFRAGYLPCALEVADSFTLAAARQRTGSRQLAGCHSLIIVELDGQETSVRREIRELGGVIQQGRPLFIDRAVGAVACERLWQVRREFSYSLRDTGLTKLNQDIVVPRGRLEDLFRFTARLQARHGLPVAAFGHAGDGNIHVNIMLDRTQPGADRRAQAALDDLFAQVLKWNGVITGEHGIGLAKKRWWPQAVSPRVRLLHQQVKHALDARGILNPGKFV